MAYVSDRERFSNVTPDQITRSRGRRRAAMERTREMELEGWQREPATRVSRKIVLAYYEATPHLRRQQRTVFCPRAGYGGTSALAYETWVKAPWEGVDVAQVLGLIQYNYNARPMYREEWETKLVLEMSKEELEVELLLAGLDKG